MTQRRSKNPRPPVKRWLFHGILVDQPISLEDEYYSEAELRQMLEGKDLVAGVSLSRLRIQALPERKKRSEKPQN